MKPKGIEKTRFDFKFIVFVFFYGKKEIERRGNLMNFPKSRKNYNS